MAFLVIATLEQFGKLYALNDLVPIPSHSEHVWLTVFAYIYVIKEPTITMAWLLTYALTTHWNARMAFYSNIREWNK